MNKRQAILEAANELFFSGDFDRVTMDEIAAKAGVSKLTVYSHFGEKDVLFSEAARHYAMQYMPPGMIDVDDDVPLRKVLTRLAGEYFDNVMAERNIAGYRVICTARVQATGIPQMAWREGPARMNHALSQLFLNRRERNEVSVDDTEEAAGVFFSLVRGLPFSAAVMAAGTPLSAEERAQHLRNAVDRFCKAYDIA